MDLYIIQYYSYLSGLVCAVIGFWVAVRQKPSEEQKLVLILEFYCFLILFGYWGCVQRRNTSEDLLIYANKLEYLGAGNVYFVLMLIYTRYFHSHMPRPLYWAQFALAVTMTAVAITFDHTHLLYRSFYVESADGLNVLVKDYGIFHTVYVAMVAGYALAFLILFIYRMAVSKGKDRWNILLLFAVVMLPSLSYLAEKIFNLTVIKLVPFSLLIVSFVLVYLVTVRRFCDICNIAHNVVFDSLDDGVIIIDSRYHVEQYNTIASELFPVLLRLPEVKSIRGSGMPFEHIFSPLFDKSVPFPIDQMINHKVYQPSIKYVRDNTGSTAGYILWLKDVTLQREKELMMQQNSEHLESMVNAKTKRIENMQDQMVFGFATLVENRNLITGQHISRTSSYVEVIATELKKEGKYPDVLSDDWIQRLRKVAPLHDIGKISVPESILDKPGKLTDDEFFEIKKHAKAGAEIIDHTMHENIDARYCRMAEDVANYHHERWDGRGYPDGLSGSQIPLAARIMAVADVFDALVSERPYKKPFALDASFGIIESESGTRFDPLVVAAFLNIRPQIEALYEELKD